jgi:hypothetical protein
MKVLTIKRATVMATFSESSHFSEKLRKVMEGVGKKELVLRSKAYLEGLFISDNHSKRLVTQKWQNRPFKVKKYNTRFYIIEYAMVDLVKWNYPPLFCN